jgi:hypothetical protein
MRVDLASEHWRYMPPERDIAHAGSWYLRSVFDYDTAVSLIGTSQGITTAAELVPTTLEIDVDGVTLELDVAQLKAFLEWPPG